MGTKLQETAASGALEHFAIGRNEQPVQHFHHNYRAAAGGISAGRLSFIVADIGGGSRSPASVSVCICARNPPALRRGMASYMAERKCTPLAVR